MLKFAALWITQIMPTPRKNLVSLEATPYYHCIGRCVRRAFLWGVDRFSGQDYSHRKAWVVQRLVELSQVFAIDICAYAVMSNHYHLVLHVDAERSKNWSDSEIALRWGSLFTLPPILSNYLNETQQDPAELPIVMALLNQYRQRLCDLSWFMRCLNEPLARRANLEDDCKGRFWEGRFKSQAILDEAGLLTCCAYVDLNPVRAGVSETPEASDFTSIQQRICEFSAEIMDEFNGASIKSEHEIKSVEHTNKLATSLVQKFKATNLPKLYPFSSLNSALSDDSNSLPYAWKDYLELVDWISRQFRFDNKRSIAEAMPPILNRLGFTSETFLHHMRPQSMRIGTVIGSLEQMQHFAEVLHQKFVKRVSMPTMAVSGGF